MSRDKAGMSRDGVPCPDIAIGGRNSRSDGAGQPGQGGTVSGLPTHAHRDEMRDSGTSPYRGVLCPDARCIAGPSHGRPFGGARSRNNSIYGNNFRAIAR